MHEQDKRAGRAAGGPIAAIAAAYETVDWCDITAAADPAIDPEQEDANRRRDERIHSAFRVSTTFVDAVRDPITAEVCYHTSEEDTVLNVSRRGAGLRCARPPEVGTRVLLEIHRPGARRPVAVIGRTCWTRVDFVPGVQGARAVAAVGIELLGGTPHALDRFDEWLDCLGGELDDAVATPPALG